MSPQRLEYGEVIVFDFRAGPPENSEDLSRVFDGVEFIARMHQDAAYELDYRGETITVYTGQDVIVAFPGFVQLFRKPLPSLAARPFGAIEQVDMEVFQFVYRPEIGRITLHSTNVGIPDMYGDPYRV